MALWRTYVLLSREK